MEAINNEIIKYYLKGEIFSNIIKLFDITYSDLIKILSEEFKSNKTINGFKKAKDLEYLNFLQTFDIKNFLKDVKKLSRKQLGNKYNLTPTLINKLKLEFQINYLNASEAKKSNYIETYGSVEKGMELERKKAVAHTNQEEKLKKIQQTNLIRFQSISPFGNKEVRNKSVNTWITKYGVDNPSKVDDVIEKIRLSSENNNGGIGWASPTLMENYKKTMLDKYGVEYACYLPQCYEKSVGCNSKPNLEFEELLKDNNIPYEKEFVINNYRYDFKVNNYLIEINPFATHNSTWGIRGENSKKDKYYYYNKSLEARINNYQCVNIWDWDNLNLIINLLKPRDIIYARKCTIKLVSNLDTKNFINNQHLQGYVKSDFNLGLYYNNELISIMTFGKPRYNKNYQYELLRYCSKYKVVGGAKKLFSYFIKNYNPESIITYCDYSKFNGKLYEDLNFKKLNNCKPSKHWYNPKTKKHITDNLLRSKGYDQLFHTNYGKGTSNEYLMLTNGFVEIYDSGQQTYIWKRSSI